ncbi:thioredoxin reductase [Haloferax larsenii JCM 13917]|nr:NAD(P)/FAD-dependent oxidoreductase [Haloferax larsenii]ELZ84306.1 thioredoxin reductase [Haloferax larsenii JCM 13917]
MTEADERQEYEVVVVGGGPAGLQTALYTTRLGHDTALVDRGGGRAAMMLDTHNVIGVTEDVSGNEFLETARSQLEDYGTDIHRDFVTEAEQLDDGRFRLVANDGAFVAERVVLGVGFNDKRPEPPLPRTGKGLHYCLHCDAYMFVDESVYVMGHSDSAAYVAMIMLNFTDDVDILLRGEEPSWSDETDELVRAHPVDIVSEEISGMNKRDDGWLESFEFEDGSVREYKGGFAMYGSEYNTALFEQLGVELNDDETVPVDDHGRTNVEGVFAVGDITPGHNQIPVAMGKGAKAGIAIHMELREFPKSLDEIRAEGAVGEADVPGISPELLAKAKQFNASHADD